MLIVYKIKAKNDFLGKNKSFQGDLNIAVFAEMLIVHKIKAKNDFLGKNKFFQGDFKISLFLPKCL